MLLVVVINLPLVQSTLTRRNVEQNGTDGDRRPSSTTTSSATRATRRTGSPTGCRRTSTRTRSRGRARWSAAAYDEAVASGQVTVRVIEGSPETARVEGQYVSRAGLYITLAADLLILALVLLLWRFGRYGRPGAAPPRGGRRRDHGRARRRDRGGSVRDGHGPRRGAGDRRARRGARHRVPARGGRRGRPRGARRGRPAGAGARAGAWSDCPGGTMGA